MNDEDQNQQIRELFLLQRVAQKINSILELDILLEEIVDDVGRTFGYSRSAILLKDDETNELVIAAGWTGNLHLKGARFKVGQEGMAGHVAATGETCYASDVRTNPYYIVSEESTRSELDIPLKTHGRLIGVFNAQHTEINGFPTSRIQLLEALADYVATAIENARMFQRERLEKELMIKELDEAQDIQLSLFPGSVKRFV